MDTSLQVYIPPVDARLAKAAAIFAKQMGGMTQREACESEGVEPQTYHNWMALPAVRAELAGIMQAKMGEAAASLLQDLPALLGSMSTLVKSETVASAHRINAFRALTSFLEKLAQVQAAAQPVVAAKVSTDVDEEEAVTPVAFAPKFYGHTDVEIRPQVNQVVEGQVVSSAPGVKLDNGHSSEQV